MVFLLKVMLTYISHRQRMPPDHYGYTAASEELKFESSSHNCIVKHL